MQEPPSDGARTTYTSEVAITQGTTGLASVGVDLERLLAHLGWTAVALHVDGLVFGAPDLARDPAAIRIPLVANRRAIAMIHARGTGDVQLLHALAPWLAATIDRARIAAARDLALTPRQAEVFALLVRGLANKEIAVQLDCAEKTVELHVTAVLKKARVSGRTQLLAWFWAR